MSQSISEKPKKRGRPATGRDPMFGLRVPTDLMVRIDQRAKAEDKSRAEVIREAVEKHLRTKRAD